MAGGASHDGAQAPLETKKKLALGACVAGRGGGACLMPLGAAAAPDSPCKLQALKLVCVALLLLMPLLRGQQADHRRGKLRRQ